ncbi:MAG: hypothetical protein U0237_20095 [Thermoleophilia bacterium]
MNVPGWAIGVGVAFVVLLVWNAALAVILAVLAALGVAAFYSLRAFAPMIHAHKLRTDPVYRAKHFESELAAAKGDLQREQDEAEETRRKLERRVRELENEVQVLRERHGDHDPVTPPPRW